MGTMTPEAFKAAKLKLALMRAEAALRRGRHLTARERLQNLERGLDMEPGTITQHLQKSNDSN